MVSRVFNLMYREVKGLHQAAYVLALFTFGSQILALLRDRLLADRFGAGSELDLYYAAFRIPDLMFVLFASTLSVYILIPFVAELRERYGDDSGRKLLSQIFTVFIGGYLLLATLVFFLSPYIIKTIFPGIAEQQTLVHLTQILLLQPLLLGVSSLYGVVTQINHRFVLYALSPIIYNLGIIIGIILLQPFFGMYGLIFGVLLGALGHMAIQYPMVRTSTLAFSYTKEIDWSQLYMVLRTSLPRAMTLSLGQLSILILFGLASLMTAGSVSVLQFAINLSAVPLSIIGVSYSVAAFPILSELYGKKEMQLFSQHLNTVLRHLIFWCVPAIALIIVLRAQIVRVVLGSGAFDWSDTRLTAAVLAILVLTLLAQCFSLLIIRAYYVWGQTLLPLLITTFGTGLSIVSSYIFYEIYVSHQGVQVFVEQLMRLDGVAGSEVLSLALGYSLGVIIQSIVLAVVFYYKTSVSAGLWKIGLLKALIASLVGAVSTYISLNFIVDGINPETFIGIFIQGLLSGIVGLTGVVITYLAVKSQELDEVYQSFHRRIFKTDVVAPQEDVI